MFACIGRFEAEDRLRDYTVALMASELIEPSERSRVLWSWQDQAAPPANSWREQMGRFIDMVRTAFGGDTVNMRGKGG